MTAEAIGFPPLVQQWNDLRGQPGLTRQYVLDALVRVFDSAITSTITDPPDVTFKTLRDAMNHQFIHKPVLGESVMTDNAGDKKGRHDLVDFLTEASGVSFANPSFDQANNVLTISASVERGNSFNIYIQGLHQGHKPSFAQIAELKQAVAKAFGHFNGVKVFISAGDVVKPELLAAFDKAIDKEQKSAPFAAFVLQQENETINKLIDFLDENKELIRTDAPASFESLS